MTATLTIPTEIGAAFEGGFYAGRFRIGNDEFALIVAPKAEGETTGKWGEYDQDVPGACSCFDGRANSAAMIEAGSDLARWALGLNINGFDDWYLPSRDELEILYRNLKPTSDENYCSFRDGDNASSVPAGYPYSKSSPPQTAAEAFRTGGAEAFEPKWHWASTQCSPDSAWIQGFTGGSQNGYLKTYVLRARAVRKIRISN
jgi:hypothetical protein